MKTIILIAALSVMISSAQYYVYANGTDSSGGGFAYSNLKIEHITQKIANQFTWSVIERTSEECLNQRLQEKGLKPMTFSLFLKIIGKIRFSPIQNRYRTNLVGKNEKLILDFGVDESGLFIVALEPFYQRFSSRISNSGAFLDRYVEEDITRLLIHEAVHHFGYNEQEASAFENLILNNNCDHLMIPEQSGNWRCEASWSSGMESGIVIENFKDLIPTKVCGHLYKKSSGDKVSEISCTDREFGKVHNISTPDCN